MLDSCFGVDTSSLITALGVGGIAVSLGFQDTLSNFIGGLHVYRDRFKAAMDDDFNTADALSVVFELVRELNSATVSEKHPTREFAGACFSTLTELTDVLGLLYNLEKNDLAGEVEALIAARANARKEKNYAEADRIRDQLKDMGIILEDTPQGVKWRKA